MREAFFLTKFIMNDQLAHKKAQILTNGIIELARNSIPYSFATAKMIWAVSNYLEMGRFTDREIWPTYQRISVEAQKIRSTNPRGFRKSITFEHPNPIKQVYEQLIEQRGSLDLRRASEIIGAFPAVLISRNENITINKMGFKQKGNPIDRYRHITLEGFTLETKPNFLLYI